MKEVEQDKNLIAFCGLYCGSCGKYLNHKCPGCNENVKATWCKVRSCCLENKYSSCADCTTFSNAKDCKKFNNIFSKFFALVFGSDRNACINMIREQGYDSFAEYMTKNKLQSLKKGK
jgi:hypothetical protein